MPNLNQLIKNFCIENKGKAHIDFNIFKKPENLYRQFGKKQTLNQFKGEIFEILLFLINYCNIYDFLDSRLFSISILFLISG